MPLVARYPMTEAMLQPYCGQYVAAMTVHGDVVCGVIDCVRDGHLVFRQTGATPAQVASMERKIKSDPAIKAEARKRGKKDVKVSFFGAGLGFGLGLVLPLFLLGALFTAPFFFW